MVKFFMAGVFGSLVALGCFAEAVLLPGFMPW
jgi:hypothetical protein